MARRSSDSGLTEHERSVLGLREEWGWFVNVVADHDGGPGFAYTFGLWEEFQHPELILYGLDPNLMLRLINHAGAQIRNGICYKDGEITLDVIEGYLCTVRRVDPAHYRETFAWALWFYGLPEFPALQLVWPDGKNRFAWEPGFDEALRSRQPDLSAAGRGAGRGGTRVSERRAQLRGRRVPS